MRPHGERSSVDLMSFRGRHHWWRHELYKSSKYLINSDMCGKRIKLKGNDGFHNMIWFHHPIVVGDEMIVVGDEMMEPEKMV